MRRSAGDGPVVADTAPDDQVRTGLHTELTPTDWYLSYFGLVTALYNTLAAAGVRLGGRPAAADRTAAADRAGLDTAKARDA